MNDRPAPISMEDLDTDFRTQGMSNSEVLRQLAQQDKELLRETLHEVGHCLAAWHLRFSVRELNVRESAAIEQGYKSVSFEIPLSRLVQAPDGTNFSLAVGSGISISENFFVRERIGENRLNLLILLGWSDESSPMRSPTESEGSSDEVRRSALGQRSDDGLPEKRRLDRFPR